MYRWLFFLLLVACARHTTTDPQLLYNHQWQASVGDVKYQLSITSAGQVRGSDGCNRFFGKVGVGQRLDFGQVASTKMACPHGNDRAFWEAIQKHDGWRIRNEELQLLLGKKVILRLQKAQAVAEQWSNEAEE